jgi:cytosine/adenosine deaminase-related metal-dependent hydrolase
MTDLLLRGGVVITMDPQRRVIPDGAVAVVAGRIAAVGPRAEVEAAHPNPAQVIEALGKAILPGLIDGHAHAGHGLVKTMANGDSEAWSEACRVIYTLGSPPSFWHAEARLAAFERLRFGVTTGVSLLGGGTASCAPTTRPIAPRMSPA